MTDSEILREIKRRLEAWLEADGWSEEGAGFATVLEWIKELKSSHETS